MKDKYLDTRSPLELAFRGLLALALDSTGESTEQSRLTYSAPGGGALKEKVEKMVGNSIVYDPQTSGAIQTFDPKRGIWVERAREEFDRHLHAFDGCPVGHSEGGDASNVADPQLTPRKTITASATGGAWSQARSQAHRPGHFADALPSVSLNGFVLWYDPDRGGIQLCDATGETGEADEPESARDARCRWYVALPDLGRGSRAEGRRAILEALEAGSKIGKSGEVVGLDSMKERHPRLEFWPGYLDSLLRSTPNPDHVHALLQEFMGACVLGTAPRHFKRGIILWGPPGSGKSVLLDLIGQREGGILLSPEWVKTGSNPGSVNQDYQMGIFQGARLIVHDEMTDLKSPRQLASYLTGQTINARKVGGDPFDLTPSGGFITSCNNPPKFWGDADGFERRMLVIRFREVFATATREGSLAEEEIWKRAEADRVGIYLWALEGAARLAAKGAPTIPPDCREAWAAFVRGSNPIHEWLDVSIEPGGAEEGILKSRLWNAYNGSADGDGTDSRDRARSSAFYRSLNGWYRNRTGKELKSRQHRNTDAEGRRRRADVYHGIRWVDEDQDAA